MPFLLYVLLKVVFEVAQGVLLVFAACLTLCCILLPVVTQTALQPLFFFERAWSLYLLRQMGYDLVGGARALSVACVLVAEDDALLREILCDGLSRPGLCGRSGRGRPGRPWRASAPTVPSTCCFSTRRCRA